MSSYSNTLPDNLFPMVLTNTTPGEILKEFEQLNGKHFFFDSESLQITDKKPPGVLQNLKDWWKRNKPKWLP